MVVINSHIRCMTKNVKLWSCLVPNLATPHVVAAVAVEIGATSRGVALHGRAPSTPYMYMYI